MEYVPPINGNIADPDRPYVDANPGASIEGSIPPAAAVEHPMREILNVIVSAGITPDDADLAQLYQAIVALIAAAGAPDASETVKGVVELATAAEAIAGTDTTRAVTSAGLASVKSLATNGYMKFPGGLILQWGVSTQTIAAQGTFSVTLPITFPTAGLSAGGNLLNTANNLAMEFGLQFRDFSSTSIARFVVQFFTGTAAGNYPNGFSWWAIGH